MNEAAAPSAAAPPARKGCLRRSCGCALGCLGILVLAALAAVVLAFATRPEAENRVSSAAEEAQPLSGAGVVRIEMEEGVLVVEPAAPGAGPSASSEHDEATSSFESTLARGDAGTWEWTVSQLPVGTLLGRALGGSRQPPKLVVKLPRDAAHDLFVRFSKGECTVELGGLPLTAVDVEAAFGQCRVAFAEPLPQPLGPFRLDASFGEFRVDGLGHASPSHVGLKQRFGELHADFSGAWRTASTVGVDFGFGEAWLRIPADLTVVADRVTVSSGQVSGPALPAAPPSEVEGAGVTGLRLTIDGRFGELRVERPEAAAPAVE